LAIVRHVVERHGGTVTALSPGRGLGAAFTVRLPLAAGAISLVRRRRQAAAPSDVLHDLRVLLVDDEADTREALGLALEASGAAVTRAGSVDEALAGYARTRPQVVVSDLSMPGGDGFALIRRIRAQDGRDAAALAVTGLASPRDREHALQEGFDAYMAKPVEPDRLVETVRMLAVARGAAR